MLSTGNAPGANERRHTVRMTEAFRLAALGTVTYLSYWKLFFAVCRTCSGQGASGVR